MVRLNDPESPLTTIKNHSVAEANQAFAVVRNTWADLLTYRSILQFECKRILLTRTAQVTAAGIQGALLAHTVLPFLHFVPKMGGGIDLASGGAQVALSGLTLYLHGAQSRANRRHQELLSALRSLSDAGAGQARGIDAVAEIAAVLDSFRCIYGPSGEIRCALLLPGPEGQLIRFCETPASSYNPGGVIAAGRGAAGVAVKLGATIYVPNVAHRHGIVVSSAQGRRTLRLADRAFECFGDSKPDFVSLLNTPVKTPIGTAVLAVVSRRADAFNSNFLFDAIELEAKLLSDLMDHYFPRPASESSPAQQPNRPISA